MVSETITLTLHADEEDVVPQAMERIATYLQQTGDCADYLLTNHAGEANSYILSSTWSNSRDRAYAWQYFTDILMSSGIMFEVTGMYSHQESGREIREMQVSGARR
jgi:hypothetical protein